MTSHPPLYFLTLAEFPNLARARHVIISIRSQPSYARQHIPDGPLLVASLTNLAIGFCNSNRLSEAEEVLLETIRIQECIEHRMHANLLRPLITLGAVLGRQRRFEQAEVTLLRALQIAGKTEALIEEHRLTLANLIYVYHAQSGSADEHRMRDYLSRLIGENPFVIKDRHSSPDE